jgi:hypothetical protein
VLNKEGIRQLYFSQYRPILRMVKLVRAQRTEQSKNESVLIKENFNTEMFSYRYFWN